MIKILASSNIENFMKLSIEDIELGKSYVTTIGAIVHSFGERTREEILSNSNYVDLIDILC